MAKNSILAPYGIDPMEYLAQIEKSAPFTMGTADPKEWSTYQRILGLNENLANENEKSSIALENYKKDQEVKSKVRTKNEDGSIRTPEEMLSELESLAAESGNLDLLQNAQNQKGSRLAQLSKQEAAQKAQSDKLVEHILKSRTPETARAMQEYYGGQFPELLSLDIKDSMFPQKKGKGGGSGTAKVGKTIKDPETGEVFELTKDGLRKLGQVTPKAKSKSDDGFFSGEDAAVAATPTPTPTPGPSYLDMLRGKRTPNIVLRRPTPQ